MEKRNEIGGIYRGRVTFGGSSYGNLEYGQFCNQVVVV